jgi:hypothetical protein
MSDRQFILREFLRLDIVAINPTAEASVCSAPVAAVYDRRRYFVGRIGRKDVGILSVVIAPNTPMRVTGNETAQAIATPRRPRNAS